MKTDRWISPNQAAKLAGVPPRTMLRRLHWLNAQHDGRIMRKKGRRRLEVSVEALQRALTTDPGLRDAEIGVLGSRVEGIDVALLSLRNSVKRLRKDVNSLKAAAKGASERASSRQGCAP